MSLRGETAAPTRRPVRTATWTAPVAETPGLRSAGGRLSTWADALKTAATTGWRKTGWKRVLVVWPVLAIVAMVVTHHGQRTALLPAFLALLLLWPATFVFARVAGTPAGAIAGLCCTALFWLQAILPAPPIEMQPSYLVRRFDEPRQVVRHVMRLPLGTSGWETMWSQIDERGLPAETRAYLYVMVATDSTRGEPGLAVQLNGQRLTELTGATRVGDAGEPQDEMSLSWHRLELSRDQLEQDALLEVSVGPDSVERFAPGTVGVVGGYSLRPTVRTTPSAFFDGTSWSTTPAALLPAWPAGVKGAARYYIELRVLRQGFRRQALTTYY